MQATTPSSTAARTPQHVRNLNSFQPNQTRFQLSSPVCEFDRSAWGRQC